MTIPLLFGFAASIAVVGFIFTCIAMPRLVRNKAQFNMAVMIVIFMLLIEVIMTFSGGGFLSFLNFFNTLLLLASFVLLILATGGMSLSDLGGEFKNTFDAVRQGPDANKPTVVPLTGATPPVREDTEVRRTYTINDPPKADTTPLPVE